jgi:hypothetical protein
MLNTISQSFKKQVFDWTDEILFFFYKKGDIGKFGKCFKFFSWITKEISK